MCKYCLYRTSCHTKPSMKISRLKSLKNLHVQWKDKISFHFVEHFPNWIELMASECQINQELNITKASTHFIVVVMHWSNWKTEYAALNFHQQLKLTADAFV